MNNLKLTFMSAWMMVLISLPIMAQNSEKVIAIVNKADWCSTCEKNGDRAMKAFKKANNSGQVLIITNDITNAETKANSAIELEKVGINGEAAAKLKVTGLTYFFNAVTKELIGSIGIDEDDASLIDAMNKALVK